MKFSSAPLVTDQYVRLGLTWASDLATCHKKYIQIELKQFNYGIDGWNLVEKLNFDLDIQIQGKLK